MIALKFLEGKFVLDKLDLMTAIFNEKFETIDVDGKKKHQIKEGLTKEESQIIWLELWKLKNDIITTISAEYPEIGAEK